MPLRWPFNVNTTQQMPLQQWQSQQQYQQQSGQQQPTQQMLYTAQQRQQIQQMQRQQQRLATEVTDLRKPSNYNTNNINVNYNNIPPPPLQQQPAQLPTQFNTRQPNSYPYYYNNYNYNNNRVPQWQGQMPRQLPANYSYPQYGVAAKNSSTEQFEKFDPSQRNARTFGFISDIINSFSSSPCVNPCTIEAYSQNRCCIVVVNPEPPVCCQYPMPRPQPPIIPPIPMPPPPPPPPPPMYPVRPPISCCSACSYGYFGPPPCGYYGGSGVIRRGGGLFGSGGLFGGGGFIGGNPGGLYLGGNVGNLGGGQFSLSVPQTSIFG